MRWTNNSRLLVGGATLLALLMVQGISDSRPRPQLAPLENAKHLPTKNERLSQENSKITKVTFQVDEDDNGFQPPASNVDYLNELRDEPASDQSTQFTYRSEPSAIEDVGQPQMAEASSPTARPYRLPSNWQVNPMFDQPLTDSTADDGTVIKVESAAAEPVAVNTAVAEKTEHVEKQQIAPALQAVDSPQSQFSLMHPTENPAESRPQPASIAGLQGPSGFSVSQSVAQKAANHIEYGKSLARRGATFAARQEFYSALQLVAQAIDADMAEPSFTRALNEALTALREASDFYVADSESQIGMNTAIIVETHVSKVVTVDEARSSTPIELMQLYYAFAEERFVLASGHHVVAAEALYCLGKLHSVMSKHDPQADQLDMAKAMVYHRACLECDPANYRSANELGTLLARNGQMQEAKSMLKRSLLIRKTPEAWKNLAIVHERIGEKELAELANQEYLINSQADISNDAPSLIQWIDASNFNATAPLQFHESTANQANAQGNTANTPAEPKPEKLIDKVKKWF